MSFDDDSNVDNEAEADNVLSHEAMRKVRDLKRRMSREIYSKNFTIVVSFTPECFSVYVVIGESL